MLNRKGKDVDEQPTILRENSPQSFDLKYRLQSTSKWTRLLPTTSLSGSKRGRWCFAHYQQ